MRAPIVYRNIPMVVKTAAPWGSIMKGVSSVAGKAMANPLARRTIIGSAAGGVMGGTGNVLFGSPEQGSIAKRWAKGTASGMALGAVGGAGYHGATRLGMPTLTQGIKKMTGAPKNPDIIKPGKSMPVVLKPGTVKMRQNANGVWMQ